MITIIIGQGVVVRMDILPPLPVMVESAVVGVVVRKQTLVLLLAVVQH
jgi:hypothetical protein